MISFSIKDNKLLFLQTESVKDTFRVKKAGTSQLPKSLQSVDKRTPELQNTFHEIFQQVFESLDSPEREVCLSLDQFWIDNNICETDADMSINEKEEFLNWVQNQREGNLWEEKSGFYQILTTGDNNKDKVLSCTIYNNVINSIRNSLKNLGVEPVWLEPSLLSISNAISYLNQGKFSKIIAVEPNGRNFNAYFYEHGTLSAIATIKASANVLSPVEISGDSDLVNIYIAEINTYWNEGDIDPNLRLFMSGEYTKAQFSTWIKEGKSDFVTIIDPFIDLIYDDITLPNREHGSWFVEPFGLLLGRRRNA